VPCGGGKSKMGRGKTKTKEKIGANKTLYYGSSANTATNETVEKPYNFKKNPEKSFIFPYII
jgi:hypothetical protein